MPKTFTHETLQPATKSTFYFIGVTTGRSSIRTVFPLWAEELGLGDVEMVGIDMEIHAPQEHYRRVVEFLKGDALSLGALVTTHKIDLYNAAKDLFDEVDPLASLMNEVSCLSKKDGLFVAHAKDPISSGLALDAFLPAGYWNEYAADLFILGAGGSAIAIDWYLNRAERGTDRPRRIIVTNRSPQRLETMQTIHDAGGTDIVLETVTAPTAADNDRFVAEISEHSVVINATGLGKDAPGSPFTDEAVFPRHGVIWDLNYRGNLLFLDQAHTQKESRDLRIEDGWIYFLHGWTQVIAEVFHIDIPTSGPQFIRLGELAASTR
ncbi:shikimate dehydrogenase family protein [Arthrobacter psychrochitiniphilus]|uniref:Shikimate dehydrogenase n=1 Tax=Arthrobacter psychrochitiniphilus TaxID=291045 RepID=A0A2V3DP23_9MICC|nr:shikimate dehydrogenase [Arthrobacter psychrochitiniphilus]NYG16085.1 shikimate 5-dehydrogenase [Arthrobacter psychrochitiniphilus]PXA63954.1 shikimate dehydrogenase [Arthrobacter psychrochitiniphilus]